MYNLNYNVTNARLNRPVGRPFVPTPRFDAFSSSLVVAIPGSIFKNGYVNVFNQEWEYDDISAYIVSGSVLDEETNQYFPLSTTQSVVLTGSLGQYTASSAVNNFSDIGYRTSIFFTGSIAAKIAAYPGNGSGVNLTTTKPFVIESWAAFPQTASFATASSGDPFNPIAVVDARPNRTLARKYLDTLPLTSSYLYEIGWTGDVDPGGDFIVVSGSSVFYINSSDNEQDFYPVSSSTWTPLEWKHYAVSYTPAGVSGSLSGSAVIRQYIDGVLISQVAKGAGDMNYAETTDTLLFGDNEFYGGNAASSSQVAGAYFQDFRMYNGSNKNYTGSQFTPPPSMIIGEVQPYPQYD